jgi:hypothetical protein
MTPPPIRHVEKKPPTSAGGQIRGRPNFARPIQVMPPHNVELTLPPTVYDEIHVPAHVSGADLSNQSPANEKPKTKVPRLRR